MVTADRICPRCAVRARVDDRPGSAFVAYCRHCLVRLTVPLAADAQPRLSAVRYGGYTFTAHEVHADHDAASPTHG